MNQQTAKSNSINTSARCAHIFANGRRCRLHATSANPSFCPSHADLPHHRPDPAETASTLTADLDDFTSPAQINDFLSRLLLLLAQDKISTRRAAVLTYIASQLLRTITAIEKEPVDIIFDAPRPDRTAYLLAGENSATDTPSANANPPAPQVRQ
jgi:hypothetical protein